METPPPTPHTEAELEDSGQFSNFFRDVSYAWEKFGTLIVGVLAVAAIVFAGYNLITNRAIAAKQNAWIDLYGSSSPESLQLVVDQNSNPAVVAVANLRAGDLLIAEARKAEADDAQAILAKAAEHYQAVYDDAPEMLYKLNALDGLAVVAESGFEIDQARKYYDEIKTLGADYDVYWVSVAERRLSLLPDISDPVVFAPEPVAEEEAAGEAGTEAEIEAAAELLTETAPAVGNEEEPTAGE